MINGEPSSALKARGSEWGALIKVEHGRQGMEGGARSAGHTHQSLSVSLSQGDNGVGVGGGGRCGWRGQGRFIGLNLTLVQARHIVSDKLFTRAPGGRTQTCQRVPNAPSGGKSSPTGKVARMNTEVCDPTRAIGIIREIHSGTATERQDQEMEDVKTQLHLTPFFLFSSSGISVQSASPLGL